jgi:hypothetical protein
MRVTVHYIQHIMLKEFILESRLPKLLLELELFVFFYRG